MSSHYMETQPSTPISRLTTDNQLSVFLLFFLIGVRVCSGRIFWSYLFFRSVKFSDNGCFTMIAETLCNLAHFLQSLAAGPTKKGFVFAVLFHCFFAFMTDPLCYLINGE